VERRSLPGQFDIGTATADGVVPFNLDKGNACYLGLVVKKNGRRVATLNLDRVWESAVEPDLARAIDAEPLSSPASADAPGNSSAPVVDAAAMESVKKTFTNLDSVTLSGGTRILRATALEEFKKAAIELQAELKQAEQAVSDAVAKGDDAVILNARKNLEAVRARQAETLKEIAARAKAQTEALEQLKQPPQ
jgi:hypothetical protein